VNAIVKLAEARNGMADAKAIVDAKRAEFEASIAEDVATLNEWKALVDERTEVVKSIAMQTYEDNGTKKFDGCEVKMFTKLDYPKDKAFEWAKESGLALTLDAKAFEKIATATELPFVTVIKEPRVTIGSDLSTFFEASN
jgi:hypothetical protein